MGEEKGGLTPSLVPNLIKRFNVIKVKREREREQRLDLLHFNWVNLIANKKF